MTTFIFKQACKLGLATTLAVLGFFAAPASAITITFESDPIGFKPNNWQSNESDLVKFSDSMGADLNVFDFDVQSQGLALAVDGDDGSFLIMDFLKKMDFLSLNFGNDDPNYTTPGDTALLQLFDGDALIDTINVQLNRDDIMNQTISYSGGAAFDRAIFFYSVAAPTPAGTLGLIELVDNVTFNVAEKVPEPTTMTGLLAFGTLGAGSMLKRKQQQKA